MYILLTVNSLHLKSSYIENLYDTYGWQKGMLVKSKLDNEEKTFIHSFWIRLYNSEAYFSKNRLETSLPPAIQHAAFIDSLEESVQLGLPV